jgi:hypothetical protein
MITIDLIQKTAVVLQKESANLYVYSMMCRGCVWAQEQAAVESALASEWADILRATLEGQRNYMDAEEFGFEAKLAGEYALTDMVHP